MDFARTRRAALSHAVCLVGLGCLLAAGCGTPSEEDPADPAHAADAADTGAADVSGGDTSADTSGEDDGDAGDEDAGELDPSAPTYHADIAPMVETHCGDCHKPDGIGPFELTSFEKLKPLAKTALNAIESGRMPPWMPDPDCRDYENERIMTAAEKATFRQWVEAGTPEGEPAQASEGEGDEPKPGTSFEATHSAKLPGGYTPSADKNDDYRCFVMDFDFPRDTYLKASRVLPDAENLVHHVLVYAVDGDKAGALKKADQKEDGPGYTCFGGPLPDGQDDNALPTQIGAWVPGLVPDELPSDLGLRIEKGSKIVMQVHYNMLEGSPEEDRTEFQMKLSDRQPEKLAETRPLAILDLNIPAGEANAVHTKTFTNYSDRPVVIERVTGHMHLLGKEITADVVREDGRKACLMDIPDWDFDWQQSYELPREEWVELKPGDGIELTCKYDNSQEAQPTVNGEKLTPRDVKWGDGSTDEMCLLYLRRIRPWEPSSTGAKECTSIDTCRDNCQNPGSLDCLMGCQQMQRDCGLCVLEQTVDCSRSTCGAQLLGAQNCLRECAVNSLLMAGPIGACMEDRCGQAYSQLQKCVDPLVKDGACTDAYDSCQGG